MCTATGCPQHELGTACATFLAQSQPLCNFTSLASFLLTPDDRTASGTSIQHMRRETDRHRGTSSAEHVAQVPVCQDANAGSRSLPTRCCFQGSCRVLHSRLRSCHCVRDGSSLTFERLLQSAWSFPSGPLAQWLKCL